MKLRNQRMWLIERIVRRIIIPLAGRGVQIQRQDAMARREGGEVWLHHAPLCGANHYHHTIPLTRRCTCGAEREWRALQSEEE